MISGTIYYVPNLMNYARVIIIIFMLAKMRTRPFIAFILCLISGMINWYDGTIARSLDQTSRFGHIMDMSLDRLTNSAQMVTLALFYPNYWLFFFQRFVS
ncbi:CDP-diacylglycerol--inositol 3-phosphatidyltransferase [Brachionus plicatilis]|uniref:CDP-diacylglycerol--inositol 3-phosphatidyltransferase n=1 Tax=Brachionus plicatilis TaxID=10195 RepID=A0A3M7T744_BRAPC|nr:CDP-diacylglycerol--inositol 3-phosphatidyltransferase [Brachionus plicatilis]